MLHLDSILQPSSKGSIFNTPLPTAESSWFQTDINIDVNGILRIILQVSITGILRLAITRSGNTKILNLNSSSSLNSSSLYSFDIPVKSTDTFNIRYSTTVGNIDFCEVQFIKNGG